MNAIQTFDKVIACLALELPESVYKDVSEKYNKFKADYAKLQEHNDKLRKALRKILDFYNHKTDENCAKDFTGQCVLKLIAYNALKDTKQGG